MIFVRECTIKDLENSSNIEELLNEYSQESSMDGLPRPFANIDTYKLLEANGVLHVIGAFENLELIGFITVLSSILPHYSSLVSVSESFFVSKNHRKGGAGTKLRIAAECHAKKVGSPGLLMSAPYGGILAEVLPYCGYRETNRVFYKVFPNE